jgi:hypothetical protein
MSSRLVRGVIKWVISTIYHRAKTRGVTLVVLPLHASDARRPSNGSRDLLLFDGVARGDSSGRDTPSATDARGPLDLDE